MKSVSALKAAWLFRAVRSGLKWAGLLVGGLLLTVAALVLLLPALISTDVVRETLEAQAGEVLGRPLTVAAIRWDWRDGIRLEGVGLADDPAVSGSAGEDLFHLDRAHLRIGWAALTQRTLRVDLRVDGISLRLVRAADGRTNLDSILARLAGSPDEEPEGMPDPGPLLPSVQIPMDLALRVEVERVGLTVIDRGLERRLDLSSGSVRLRIPSLMTEAVRLSASGDLSLDGNPVPGLGLALKLENLFDADGRMTPLKTALWLTAEFPGTRLAAVADADARRLTVDGGMDLERLWSVLAPLMPAPLSETRPAGRIDGAVRVTGTSVEAATFVAGLRLADLSAAGGALGDGSVGPLSVRMETTGRGSLWEGGRVEASGRFDLLTGTRIRWEGTAVGVGSEAPTVDLSVGPVRVDLAEIFQLAEGMIPESVSVSLSSGDRSPRLTVDGIHLSAAPRAGDATLTVDQLRLDFPEADLRATPSAPSAAVRDLSARLDRLDASLSAFSPESLDLAGGIDLGEVRIDGADGVRAGGSASAALTFRKTGGDEAGFTMDLEAAGIFAQGEGGPLKGLSPADLGGRLTLAGRIADGGETVHLDRCEGSGLDGGLALSDLSGRVTGLVAEGHAVGVVDLTLSGLTLDLDKLIDRLGLDLPDGISLASGDAGTRLTVAEGHLSGSVPDGPLKAKVGGIELDLPGIGFSRPDLRVEAEGFRGRVDELTATLRPDGPIELDLSAGAEIDQLTAAAAGEAPLGARASRPPGGAGHTDPDTSGVEARVRGISGAVSGRCALSLDTGIEVVVPSLDLAGAEIEATVPMGTGPPVAIRFDTGAEAHFDAGRIAVETLAPRPAGIRLEGGSARLRLGELFKAEASLAGELPGPPEDARIEAEASGTVDLNEVPDGLLAAVRPGAETSGRVTGRVSVSGRPPTAAELEALGSLESFGRGLPFLDRLEAEGRIADLRVRTRGAGLAVGPVTTEAPLTYRLDGETLTGRVAGDLSVAEIAEVPGAGRLDPPLSLRLSFSGEHRGLDAVEGEQTLTTPWPGGGITESASFSLTGLSGLLTQGAAGLRDAGGRLTADFEVAETEILSGLVAGVEAAGPAAGTLNLTVTPGEAIDGRVRVRCGSDDQLLTVRVGETAAVSGLDVDLSLSRRLAIRTADGSPEDSAPALTDRVMAPETAAGGRGEPRDPGAYDLAGDVLGQSGDRPPIAFQTAWLAVGPLAAPLTLGPGRIDFRWPGRLPEIRRFRFGLLGGTVLGELTLEMDSRRDGAGVGLSFRAGFTGIDTGLLSPDGSAAGEGSEIGGKVFLSLPVVSQLRSLLAGLDLDLRLSPIGPRALERILFALDPYESNEAIVSQRRLLRTGTPVWVRVRIRGGSLSLTGEAAVGGTRIDFPPLNRLPLGNLSGLSRYEPLLAPLETVRRALGILGAEAVVIDADGNPRLE